MAIVNYSYNKYKLFWDSDGSNQAIRNALVMKDENNNPWDTKSQGFNTYGFQKLIDARQYETAADYASLFHFNDPDADNRFRTKIAELRRRGRRLSAVYQRLTTQRDRDLFDFGQAVFSPRGLENLAKDPNHTNQYVDEFVKWKNKLGSTKDADATQLRITFDEPSSGLFGFLGLGGNENTIDNLYADSGLSEADLIKSGVDVKKDGGRTTLTFHKSNDLANTILANVNKRGGRQSGIIGLDEAGNVLNSKTDIDWNEGRAPSRDEKALRKLQSLMDSSKALTEAAIEDNSTTEESTTRFGYLSNDVANIEQRYAAGLINNETYNLMMKMANEKYTTAIAGLVASHQVMYSDWNDTNSDTMTRVEGQDATDLINYISQNLKGNTVRFEAAINGSEVGTYITVDAKEGTDNKEGHPRVTVFIPNFLTDEVNAKINQNTNSRAVLELNDMERYNYDYTLSNGKVLRPTYNRNGDFYIRDKGRPLEESDFISREEALKEMSLDVFMEGSGMFRNAFTSESGRLLNRDGFEQVVKGAITKQINETYNESEPLSVEDIFDDDSYVDGAYSPDPESTQYQKYRKINKALELYYRILNSIKYMEDEYQ